MRIIAYTYEADYHCADCAVKRNKAGGFKPGTLPGEDEHGIRDDAEDNEGNPLHPVFSTDEIEPGVFCGDCGKAIE